MLATRLTRRAGWGFRLALLALVPVVATLPGADKRQEEERAANLTDRAEPSSLDDVSAAANPVRGSDLDGETVEQLLGSYDKAYADVVGDRNVLYGPSAEAQDRIAAFLTPDSPLLPTKIYGGTPDLGDPMAFRSVQVPGRQLGGHPPGRGERNAQVPIFHEVLSVPFATGEEVAAYVCVHLDWVIRPDGERPPWIQSVSDAEISGEVVIRREGEAWRIHDWRLTGDLFGPTPDDRCSGRCGPDPGETAVRNVRWGPTGRDDDGDGYEDWANGPPPDDPPCRTD